MIERLKKLLAGLRGRRSGESEFNRKSPSEAYSNSAQIDTKVDAAISKEDPQELELLAHLLAWDLPDDIEYINSLNKLLLTPYHNQHQYIARKLQKLKSPSSIPYIRKVLASNFDYLPYTGSDSDGMAKWFSWVLAEIGTGEAIQVLKEYSHSTDEGIRNEMVYRLKKLDYTN